MSRRQRILDSAENGASADALLPNRITTVYVLSGSADVTHIDDVIVSLLPGERKVIDGLAAGERITVVSTSSNTTMELVG